MLCIKRDCSVLISGRGNGCSQAGQFYPFALAGASATSSVGWVIGLAYSLALLDFAETGTIIFMP